MTPSLNARTLMQHVVQPWFPRSIDREYGGFLCDFDRQWRQCGPHRKLLEFQARQTLAAAELLILYPDDPVLAEAVGVGFAFLRDVLWDSEYGGWHAVADRSGLPLRPKIKHTHGMAYATQACLAVYAATGDQAALGLANVAFEWLDRCARDDVHHGYFGPLWRDGSVMLEAPDDRPTDLIGTPFGWKDMNVNNDFYEMLIYAAAIPGSHSSVPARLGEMRDIVLSHYAVPGQMCWHFFTPAWEPAGSECRPGTAVQTAGRLLEDSSAPDPKAQACAARHLLSWAIEYGLNASRGALHFSICVGAPKQDIRNLQWWPQLELLKITAYLAYLDPDDESVRELRDHAEKLVTNEVLDDRFFGSRALVRSALGWRGRYLPFGSNHGDNRKGYDWKDASHDARVLIRLIGLEHGHLAAGPPPPSLASQLK